MFAGDVVGHYRIRDRIGGGGMGVVYRAEDLKLGRTVALKFLPPELLSDSEAKERFLNEARAASLLEHPNICTIFDVGESEDGQTWISMPCYDGENVEVRLRRGRVDVRDALRIIEQVARGLGKAHAAGIVHRDIKPANVMVTNDGVVKVLDFGLAKLRGVTLTRTNTTVGTAAYMSPEQLRGDPVGPPSDIWSLGVVLFELLTGTRPFPGDLTQAVSYAIVNEKPPSLTQLLPTIPPEVDRIVKKMLRKDPSQRYATVEELIADLQPLLTPSSGSGGSSSPALRRLQRADTLKSGARLGPYQIEKPLGSGGMGDVYLARDTRLDRSVAVKVLSPEFGADPKLTERFHREARTISSLAHPNICTLFDVGEQDGVDYLVMEFLEGETLADRLHKGLLPTRLVVEYGAAIADALAAAHRQGIVHRDLKPSNVMLLKSGGVKLLDFGLAKDIGGVSSSRSSPTESIGPGSLLLGTLPYMAPEQIEGIEVDARTDIWALGAILYEMLTGTRAFSADSKATLIAAIIDREPEPLADVTPALPPILENIVSRALKKSPDHRWQCAADIAHQLRWSTEVSGVHQKVEPERHIDSRFALAGWVAALVVFVAGAFIFSRQVTPKVSFQRLTYDARALANGRFTSDGKTIVFTLAQPAHERLLTMRTGSLDVRELPFGRSVLAAVSKDDELLFVSSPKVSAALWDYIGVLERASANAPAGRAVLEEVHAADWGPDGSIAAVISRGTPRVEYPIGTVVYRAAGWIGDLRVSPDGKFVAFVEHQPGIDDGIVRVVDRTGSVSSSQPHPSLRGLAWKSNTEVWFSAGNQYRMYSFTPGRKERVLFETPEPAVLLDINAAGDALIAIENWRIGMGLSLPDGSTRDLSWLDNPILAGFTSDQQNVVFSENGLAGVASFIRGLDGSPAVKLADGVVAQSLSADGLSFLGLRNGEIVLCPVGAGEVKQVTNDGSTHRAAQWMPGGRQIVYAAMEPGGKRRIYARELASGVTRLIAENHLIGWNSLSPDGQWLVERRLDGAWIIPVNGGTARKVPGISEPDELQGWVADSKSIYATCIRPEGTYLSKFDITTGVRTEVRKLPVGVNRVIITPDESLVAYTWNATVHDLYLVRGVR